MNIQLCDPDLRGRRLWSGNDGGVGLRFSLWIGIKEFKLGIFLVRGWGWWGGRGGEGVVFSSGAECT